MRKNIPITFEEKPQVIKDNFRRLKQDHSRAFERHAELTKLVLRRTSMHNVLRTDRREFIQDVFKYTWTST